MSIIKKRLSLLGMILFFILGALSMMFFLNNLNHKGKDIIKKTSQAAKDEIEHWIEETHDRDAMFKTKREHMMKEYPEQREIPKAPEMKSQSNQQTEIKETHDQKIAHRNEKGIARENIAVKEVVKPKEERSTKEDETVNQIVNEQPKVDKGSSQSQIIKSRPDEEMEKKPEAVRVVTKEEIREIYKKRLEALRYLE